MDLEAALGVAHLVGQANPAKARDMFAETLVSLTTEFAEALGLSPRHVASELIAAGTAMLFVMTEEKAEYERELCDWVGIALDEWDKRRTGAGQQQEGVTENGGQFEPSRNPWAPRPGSGDAHHPERDQGGEPVGGDERKLEGQEQRRKAGKD